MTSHLMGVLKDPLLKGPLTSHLMGVLKIAPENRSTFNGCPENPLKILKIAS